MTRILLLGCGGSAGINFIKALRLSKTKIYIIGIDRNKYYLEMSPVDKRYLIEHSKNQEKEYIEKIAKIVKKEKIDFVHAQPDAEVKILSDYRNLIPKKIFLPSKNVVDISQDKLKTYLALKIKKVPVADTYQINNLDNLKEIFKKIKGTVWLRAKEGAGGKASLPVKEINHAKMWIDYWMSKGLLWSDFIANEFLPGREVSWLSIWKDGELICSQQKERIEWVQSGISPSNVAGTTAIQKTVNYENVNDISTATIKAVDKSPNGIYVVDTKENKDGIPCVTEINPGRFFTTSLFFATAGCNMPLIYLKLGLGERIGKVSQYNSLKKDYYWIRVPDGGPTMVSGESWSSKNF